MLPSSPPSSPRCCEETQDTERELTYYRHRLEVLLARRAANPPIDPGPSGREPTDAARYRLLLEALGEGMIGLDLDGRCTYANPAALALFGTDGEAGPLGRDFHEFLARQRSGEPPAAECPLAHGLREGVHSRFTATLARPGGGSLVAEFSSYPLRAESGSAGAVVMVRDISEAQALARRLSYEASHDPLTGLYNRAEFERRVAQALVTARLDDAEHALCFLDLDRFKAVNDTCGHAAGDQLLQALGALMQSRLRQSDVLARLGGDEFGVLLDHCPIEQAWLIANELREAAHNFRFSWAGAELSVGMSVGIAALNATSGDVAAVLNAADKACYIAKRRGGDGAHLIENPAPDRPTETPAPKKPGRSLDGGREPPPLSRSAAFSMPPIQANPPAPPQ